MYIENLRMKLLKDCEDGIKGEKSIIPNTLNLCLTNRCNLHCIICPFVLKEYENKTYNNEIPYFITLKQYKEMLPYRENTSEKNFFSDVINFHFLWGETLLNPEIYAILKYTKEIFPNSIISILSNGTIPPVNEDIVKYIDILGFSIDGATKETFELIRQPANFERVVENMRKWNKARNQYNPELKFRTSTTLSKMNIEELPSIVELVAGIGGFDSVYVQPLGVEDYQDRKLMDFVLNKVETKIGHHAIKKAFEISNKTQVRIDMADSIKQMFNYKENYLTNSMVDDFPYIMCDKLRGGILSYQPNGKGLQYACCFMDKKYWKSVIKQYNIPDEGSPFEIYNSVGFWKLRKDLLNGKLSKECGNCMIGKSEYYRLKSEREMQLSRLEQRNIELEQRNIELEQRNIELEQRNIELEQNLNLKNSKIVEYENQITRIYSTFSWRVTTPLRIIRKWF